MPGTEKQVWRNSEKFHGQIMRCVENGMDVLGDSGRMAIIYHIEARFGLKEEQIPQHPKRFVLALENIFGKQAGTIIGAILEQMRLNASCNREFLRFATALKDALHNDPNLSANYLATIGANNEQLDVPY